MKTLGSVCIWLVCFGMVVPSIGNCEESRTAEQPFIQDVALDSIDRLTGRMVDRNGAALANELVELQSSFGDLQQTSTDGEGNFVFADVRGGTYAISIGEVEQFTRIWTLEAAPPAATRGLLIVGELDPVERGQQNCNCQNCNSQPQRRTPNRKRRRTLARIGLRGAMIPFSMVSAFGAAAAADDEEEGAEEEGVEEEGGDSGDSGTAS